MADASSAAPIGSFWQRRMVEPIVTQLTQGVTPAKIAATLAVGTSCSLFPFLGFTSLLNLGVGLWLRMNQPMLQTLNQLLGPLQLIMIVAYVRLGEWIWQAEGDRFTIADMLHVFHEASFGAFLHRFGWAGVHAFTAWLLTVPLLSGGIYFSLSPVLRRLNDRPASAGAPTRSPAQ